MVATNLILASASPRRAQLLRQIAVDFSICAQDIDESLHSDESPQQYVCRMADEKANAALSNDEAIVIASDTSVVVDNLVLGKPMDEDDAVRMLLKLSSREHEVLTAVTVADSTRRRQSLSTTRVRFRAITEDEAHAYWHTGEPCDKAGAYAIQGLGAVFVADISGSYSGVMGLPLFETASLLAEFGVSIWPEVYSRAGAQS